MRARLTASLFFLCAAFWLSQPAQAQLACPNPFVAGAICTPVTASATGTTGAITATLAAVAGKTFFICETGTARPVALTS